MSELVRAFHPERLAPVLKSAGVGAHSEWLEQSFDLEIGCGVGWHPIRYARENKSRKLIAIEHTRAKFAGFARRLEKHGEIANLWAVHADAIRWVTQHVPANSVERCLFMYPNPEPKAPNKRWLRSPFFHRVLHVLKTGGEIWLATNEREYFDEALEYAREQWPLELVLSREFDRHAGIEPRTHFEKKYLARGETCFEAHWRKT